MSHLSLRAVLFADAVGYSRHMAEAEDETLAAMERCLGIFRALAPEYDGEIVKGTGDGVMAEFGSAEGALRYALAAQASFTRAAGEGGRQLAFRIGIHLGDVQRRAGDLYGHIVNVASRLEGLSEPGAVCISQAVYEQAAPHVRGRYRSLGARALKNIAGPVAAYMVRPAGPDAAPPATPRALQLAVLDRLALRSAHGDVLTPRSLKAQALLGYLVLNHRPAEHRDRIASLLWSDLSRDQAQQALRAAVRQLRQACGRVAPDSLAARSSEVALTVATIEVDLLAVSEALADGRLAPDLVEGRVLPQAILAGLDDVDQVFAAWLRVTRHRWRDRLVAQLENCLGRFGDDALSARHAATALLAIDPTHEPAACALMRLLAADGQAAAALRIYRSLAEVLSQEFGLEPSPEAKDIVSSIRSGRPGSISTASPTHAHVEDRLPVIAVAAFGGAAAGAIAALLGGVAVDLVACLIRFRDWVVVEEAGESAASADYRIVARAGADFLVLTLTDGASKRVVWSEQVSTAATAWAMESGRVVRRIAAALDIYLSAERVARPQSRRDQSLEAYDQWLRGETLLTRWEQEAEEEAERLFRQVIERMPAFAPAFASLASIYNVRHLIVPGFRRDASLEAEALMLAQKAVALDPLETRAHLTLAWSCAMAGRFEQADVHYDLAFELNPNNPRTLVSCAHGLGYTGRLERAAELEKAALTLIPVATPSQWGYIAGIRFLCGDYLGCISAAERGAGSLLDVGAWQAAALAHLDRPAEARQAGERFLADARSRWRIPTPSDRAITDWVLHGLPFRHEAARTLLVAGLARAGLPVGRQRDLGESPE